MHKTGHHSIYFSLPKEGTIIMLLLQGTLLTKKAQTRAGMEKITVEILKKAHVTITIIVGYK